MSTQTLDQPAVAAAKPHPVVECMQLLEAAGLRYITTSEGEPRELVVRSHAFVGGATVNRVVIDRSRINRRDNRIVGYLFPEEPAANVVLMCQDYLHHPTISPSCSSLKELLSWLGQHDGLETPPPIVKPCKSDMVCSARKVRYCLVLATIPPVQIPQLRWWRCSPLKQAGPGRPVSLREVCAATEAYSPYLGVTTAAVEHYQDDPEVSVSTLRGERRRLAASRVVLNRGLREAVQARTSRDISLSEIAQRCGRTKTSRKGDVSGETSWLSRRLGLMPEGGESHPTPWVHTDVLNLIAMRGLDISPHEVEVA